MAAPISSSPDTQNAYENIELSTNSLYDEFDVRIESTIHIPRTSPTVVERYFTSKFKPDVKENQGEDLRILCHSNKLCIVMLSQNHSIIAADKTVDKVDFQVTKSTNLLDNKVVGKRKKGGQWMTADSKLCIITCSDGSSYTIYSCINGRLVEINEDLSTNPALIKKPAHAGGYIGVIFPRLETVDQQLSKLQSVDEYNEIVAARTSENEQQQKMNSDENNGIDKVKTENNEIGNGVDLVINDELAKPLNSVCSSDVG